MHSGARAAGLEPVPRHDRAGNPVAEETFVGPAYDRVLNDLHAARTQQDKRIDGRSGPDVALDVPTVDSLQLHDRHRAVRLKRVIGHDGPRLAVQREEDARVDPGAAQHPIVQESRILCEPSLRGIKESQVGATDRAPRIQHKPFDRHSPGLHHDHVVDARSRPDAEARPGSGTGERDAIRGHVKRGDAHLKRSPDRYRIALPHGAQGGQQTGFVRHDEVGMGWARNLSTQCGRQRMIYGDIRRRRLLTARDEAQDSEQRRQSNGAHGSPPMQKTQ